MGTTIISDKYGNRKRISDTPNGINLILNMPDNRKKIANKPNNINAIISVSNNRNRVSNISYDGKKDSNMSDELHTCTKNISSCQEKEDRNLWLYIGTYKSKVNFCPYCGYKAKK